MNKDAAHDSRSGMDVPGFMVALQAVREGAMERGELARLLVILDNWQRGGLEVSIGEILTREFRIDPARVRKWEQQLSGARSRRIGKYTLKRRIGQGGMGVVFEAEDPNFNRPVALKILSPALGKDPAAIQGFLREVKSAGRFNHPNIVHAYDAGIDGDIPFLVMEYVDGENLFQVFSRSGPLPVDRAAGWLLEAARALSILEGAGWIHGDGKPSNWIVDESGHLKLADLGLCRPPGKPRKGETLFGSPPYIAPESLTGKDRVDIRADLYSLGATFYHLLAGRPHYKCRSGTELRKCIAEGPPDPITRFRDDLPASLVSVIARLIAPAVADRHRDCRELIEELEEVVRVEGFTSVLAAQPAVGAPAEEDEEPESTSPTSKLLMAGIVVVLLALVGVVVSRLGENETPEKNEPEVKGVVAADDESDGRKSGPSFATEVWSEMWDKSPRNYVHLFEWLDSDEAVSDQNVETWRQQAETALAREAAEDWNEIRNRVRDELLLARRYHDSLTALDSFPERFRIGRFELERDHLVASTRKQRATRLGTFKIQLRTKLAADDMIGARAAFGRINEEPEADADWYREQLVEEFDGVPWITRLARFVSDHDTSVAERVAHVRSELSAGRVPPAVLAPGENLPLELALHLIDQHRDLVAARQDLRVQLLEEGLFLSADPGILALVIDLLGGGTTPPVSKEIDAARIARGLAQACRNWNLERADEAWTALGREEYALTAAVEKHLTDAEDRRDQLELGVFLRSDAFRAVVSGSFGEPPVLRYDFTDEDVFREWRSHRSQWKSVDGGQQARNTMTTLESFVPFDSTVEVSIHMDQPKAPWSFYIHFGDVTVGFARRTPGELLVVSGGRKEVKKGLEAGSGFWQPGAAAFDRGSVTISCRISDEAVRIRCGGAELSFPNLELLTMGFTQIQVPNKTLIRSITLAGHPARAWLEKRRELSKR